MKSYTSIFISILIVLSSCVSSTTKSIDLEKGFKNPPVEARPHVWWHWLDGHISKEGITKDLKAMAEQGIGGATILSIGINTDEFKGRKPTYDYMSPDWKEMVKHAFSEAEKHGLRLSIHNCDGWSHSGGPWVSPEQSMKTLTFSKTYVNGGKQIEQKLPEPPHNLNFYKDVAVIAYPATASTKKSMYRKKFTLTSSHKCDDIKNAADANVVSAAKFFPSGGEDKPVELIIEFEEPFTATTVAIADYLFNQNQRPATYKLEYSNDGEKYKQIQTITVSAPKAVKTFEAVTAKFFKLVMIQPPKVIFHEHYFTFHEVELLGAKANSSIVKINDFLNKSSNFIRRRDYLKPTQVEDNYLIDKSSLINISSFLTADGTLKWDAPEGEWEIIRVGYTTTGRTNSPATKAGKGLECDKMSAKHVEDYFNAGPQILVDETRDFIGKSFTHLLTDSWEAYGANWTENFPEEFGKRRGYNMAPFMPVLCDEIVGSVEESERFLWDFRRTIADLYKENCYAKLQELCEANGLNFQAEASGAQQNMMDPITYPSVTDKPMTEFWVLPEGDNPSMRPNGAFMGAIASSHLYNKKVVAAEAFTSSRGNWRHAPYNLKKAGDQAYALGINMFYFHDYAHQPDESLPGWQMVPWGIAMNRKLTWWNMAAPYFDYLGRCQYLLQQGDFVGDILAFIGEDAGKTVYLAYPYGAKCYGSREVNKKDLADWYRKLSPKGYAWSACNAETIIKRLKVKNGRLVLPHGPTYEVLMLPENVDFTPELLSAIKRLVVDGAKLYAPKPQKSPSLVNYPHCDGEVQMLTDEIWGKADGEIIENSLGKGKVYWGITLEEVLTKKNIQPDFDYFSDTNEEPDVMYLHRKLEDQDLYFVSNQSDKDITINGKFRIAGKIPEIWNPETGEILNCDNYLIQDNKVQTSFSLAPYGSTFIVFRNNASSSKVTAPDSKTDVKTIQVGGNWTVKFPKGWGAPGEIVFENLTSWHMHADEGIKYFSGTATYKKEIVIADDFIENDAVYKLELGKVNELAEVYINETKAGIVWKPPYTTDIGKLLKKGKNIIEIKVANHWVNRLIGDELGKEEERYLEPITRRHYDEKSEQVLLPSGLVGPVTIHKIMMK